MELSNEHIELMFFVKDECISQGSCSFAKVAALYGNDIVMELIIEYGLITYDGKKPLGIKWSDIAEDAFKTEVDMRGFASTLYMQGPMPVIMGLVFPQCDSRIADVQDIPPHLLPDDEVPTQEEVDGIEVGQGVKVFSKGKFFWVCIVEIKETMKDSGIFSYFGKVVDSKMEPHGFKQDEIVEFCGGHICDII